MDPIKNMDLCRVVSRKGVSDSGLVVGDKVLVIGLKVVPVSRSDPYLQRVLSLTVLVKDNVPLIPRDDNDYKAYLIDPRALERISDEKENKSFKDKVSEIYEKDGKAN